MRKVKGLIFGLGLAGVLAGGAVGWAKFDPNKVQHAGCYVELARAPVPFAGCYEYIVNFYAKGGGGGQDGAIWGFENDNIANFEDLSETFGEGYERILMQFWSAGAAGARNLVFGGSVFPFPSEETDGDGVWERPGANPTWEIINSWHTPGEYVGMWEDYHTLPAIHQGEIYGYGHWANQGPASQDLIYVANIQGGGAWGQGGDGLRWTVRIVTTDRFNFGDITWSIPTLGGRNPTGGLWPVLGDWKAPAPPHVAALELFYNGKFDNATDPAKTFLAVGQASQVRLVGDDLHGHVTNYAGGITGIRLTFDTVVTFAGGVAAAFTFEATPEQSASKVFSSFTPPTTPGYEVDHRTGKTTVTITFTDGEIKNRWLKTIVNAAHVSVHDLNLDAKLADPLTLPSGDGTAGENAEFIIGHRLGEVDRDHRTSLSDVAIVRGKVGKAPVSISNAYDVDKNGTVLLNDAILARNAVSPVPLPRLP